MTTTVVVAIATVLLAVLTARYVKLTGRLVEESKRLRDPVVTVDFELPDWALIMVIENHGLTAAKDVRIELLKDTDWLCSRSDGGSQLADVGAVKTGVSYLTPDRKLKYEVGHPNWQDMPEGPVDVCLRLTYESLSGEQFSETVSYDFRQVQNVLFDSFRDPNAAVAKAIRDAESSRRSQGQMAGFMSRMVAPTTKNCEFCAEPIRADAKKCKHCGEMQTAFAAKAPVMRRQKDRIADPERPAADTAPIGRGTHETPDLP